MAPIRRIDALFAAWPLFGARRMTAMLRAETARVNRERVRRLMATMGEASQRLRRARLQADQSLPTRLLRHQASLDGTFDRLHPQHGGRRSLWRCDKRNRERTDRPTRKPPRGSRRSGPLRDRFKNCLKRAWRGDQPGRPPRRTRACRPRGPRQAR
ncbi:MAG: IS3 family transposase [Methylocella sp.]